MLALQGAIHNPRDQDGRGVHAAYADPCSQEPHYEESGCRSGCKQEPYGSCHIEGYEQHAQNKQGVTRHFERGSTTAELVASVEKKQSIHGECRKTGQGFGETGGVRDQKDRTGHKAQTTHKPADVLHEKRHKHRWPASHGGKSTLHGTGGRRFPGIAGDVFCAVDLSHRLGYYRGRQWLYWYCQWCAGHHLWRRSQGGYTLRYGLRCNDRPGGRLQPHGLFQQQSPGGLSRLMPRLTLRGGS